MERFLELLRRVIIEQIEVVDTLLNDEEYLENATPDILEDIEVVKGDFPKLLCIIEEIMRRWHIR